MADNYLENGSVVTSFKQCFNRVEGGLQNAPGLLLRIIHEDMWKRRFVRHLAKEVTFKRFEDFVTTPPLEGLGETLDAIKRVCRDDPEALDAIDQVTKRKDGNPHVTGNIVPGSGRPEGNTRAKALRRLREHREDLHAQVLSGKLTAHAAMIEAGFRKPTITVELTAAGVLKAYEKLPAVEREKLEVRVSPVWRDHQ